MANEKGKDYTWMVEYRWIEGWGPDRTRELERVHYRKRSEARQAIEDGKYMGHKDDLRVRKYTRAE